MRTWIVLAVVLLSVGVAYAGDVPVQAPVAQTAVLASPAAPQAGSAQPEGLGGLLAEISAVPQPDFKTCTFITNDCNRCAGNKVQNCDFYNCDGHTVLRNCTPCANFC
ncbi:MAG TPA: hypothetical protein VIA62_07040 [Thermoanaerobaculia bacterium]|jgi:hypothetical protein|nr:hypothetical protein [Thermoanaerobaculia bacterium]